MVIDPICREGMGGREVGNTWIGPKVEGEMG